MKHLMILTVGLSLLFTALPAVAQSDADEAAIRDAVKQIYATWNAHDAKANAAFDDEVFEEWDGTVKGPSADEKRVAELFEQQKDIQRNMRDEIGIVFVTPDVAIYKLRSEITGSIDEVGNPQPPFEFLHAMVLVKRSGKWLYAATFTRPMEE